MIFSAIKLPIARVVTLLLCLVACGCDDAKPPDSASAETSAPATPFIPAGGSLRFLALGDSCTKGEGVPLGERWPVQLAAKLRASGVDVADPQIIAETGWRTDNLLTGIDDANPQGPFHLVSLLIGVNNQFQGGTVETYRTEFEALLRRAISLADGDPTRVLVLSIPDWGATPYGRMQDTDEVAGAIDQFNVVNRDLSLKAGVRYVDVTPLSRTAAVDPQLTITDDLHPSGKMYAAWAKLAMPEATRALAVGPE